MNESNKTLNIEFTVFFEEFHAKLADRYEQYFLSLLDENLTTIIFSCDRDDWEFKSLIAGLISAQAQKENRIQIRISEKLSIEKQKFMKDYLKSTINELMDSEGGEKVDITVGDDSINSNNPQEVLKIDTTVFFEELQGQLAKCYQKYFSNELTKNIDKVILSCEASDWEYEALAEGLILSQIHRKNKIQIYISGELPLSLQKSIKQALINFIPDNELYENDEYGNNELEHIKIIKTPPTLKTKCIDYIVNNGLFESKKRKPLPDDLEEELKNSKAKIESYSNFSNKI